MGSNIVDNHRAQMIRMSTRVSRTGQRNRPKVALGRCYLLLIMILPVPELDLRS